MYNSELNGIFDAYLYSLDDFSSEFKYLVQASSKALAKP